MLLGMRGTHAGSAGKSLRSLRVLAQRLGYDILCPLFGASGLFPTSAYIGNIGSCVYRLNISRKSG